MRSSAYSVPGFATRATLTPGASCWPSCTGTLCTTPAMPAFTESESAVRRLSSSARSSWRRRAWRACSCAPTAASSAARRCSSILARSPSWPEVIFEREYCSSDTACCWNARSSATACRRADSAFACASASEERRSRRWLSSSSRAAANSARAAATSSSAASAARSTSGFDSWTMTVSGSTVSPARTSTRSTRASTRVESQRASRGCRTPGPRTLRSSVPSFTSSR